MSGETAKAESGWTVDTLKEYIEALRAGDKLALDAALAASKEGTAAALAAAEKAVEKAERASDKRFDTVNEFRQTLSDQASMFMPRLEADQRFAQINEKIDAALSRLDIMAGGTSGGDRFRAGLLATVAAVGSGVAIVVAIITVLTR